MVDNIYFFWQSEELDFVVAQCIVTNMNHPLFTAVMASLLLPHSLTVWHLTICLKVYSGYAVK